MNWYAGCTPRDAVQQFTAVVFDLFAEDCSLGKTSPAFVINDLLKLFGITRTTAIGWKKQIYLAGTYFH